MMWWKIGIVVLLAGLFSGCGEEYYSTPQKTLTRYVDNRMMMSREQYEACLNAFTKEDRQWFEKHYTGLCRSLYAQDCPGEGLPSAVTVWTDVFEPAGPRSAEVESAEIDAHAGTARLVVNGKAIEFIKQQGNWKIHGFFGEREVLEKKYPQILDPNYSDLQLGRLPIVARAHSHSS